MCWFHVVIQWLEQLLYFPIMIVEGITCITLTTKLVSARKRSKGRAGNSQTTQWIVYMSFLVPTCPKMWTKNDQYIGFYMVFRSKPFNGKQLGGSWFLRFAMRASLTNVTGLDSGKAQSGLVSCMLRSAFETNTCQCQIPIVYYSFHTWIILNPRV